jgi:hypothetical protein
MIGFETIILIQQTCLAVVDIPSRRNHDRFDRSVSVSTGLSVTVGIFIWLFAWELRFMRRVSHKRSGVDCIEFLTISPCIQFYKSTSPGTLYACVNHFIKSLSRMEAMHVSVVFFARCPFSLSNPDVLFYSTTEYFCLESHILLNLTKQYTRKDMNWLILFSRQMVKN